MHLFFLNMRVVLLFTLTDTGMARHSTDKRRWLLLTFKKIIHGLATIFAWKGLSHVRWTVNSGNLIASTFKATAI